MDNWNRGLLLGELLIVIAGMALVSGRTGRDRLLASAMLAQGIAMMLMAGSAYFPQAELALAAVALLVVQALQLAWTIPARSPKGSIPALTTCDPAQVPQEPEGAS